MVKLFVFVYMYLGDTANNVLSHAFWYAVNKWMAIETRLRLYIVDSQQS